MSAVQQALFAQYTAASGITLVGYTTVSGSSSGVVNKPSGVVAGDIIVMFAWDSNLAAWSIGSPGFTDLQGGVATKMGAAYRIAGGSEPSTYFITNGGTFTGVICAAFRGSSGLDVAGPYFTDDPVNTIVGYSLNAVAANCLLIGGFTASGNVSFATPTGMTAIGRSTDPSAGMFYQQLTATGATGNRSSLLTPGGYAAGSMLLTLKP